MAKSNDDLVFEDDEDFESVDGKVYKSLDYNKVLLRQIDRVNQSISQGKELFVNAVECLEAIVYPLSDDIFSNTMRDSQRGIEEFLEKAKSRKATNPLMFDFAMYKYKQIMKLLQRRGFFPPTQRTVYM